MPILEFIQPHAKNLSPGFDVRRLLPAAVRQSVGPFLFFDHFGPVEAGPGDNHDVRPHPHIGLATVTYLFEGAMLHRDSLGAVQRIEPGAINWMTAGSGIVHSERTPPDLRDKVRRSHGLQLWVGLPKEFEEVPASFAHTAAADIPLWTAEGVKVRVLIGALHGLRSPVQTFAPTLYLDVELAADATIELPADIAEERAVYAVDGTLDVDGVELSPFTMVVLEPGAAARIRSKRAAHFVLIGGAPMDGHRHMWWNFVSSRQERIEEAKQAWAQQAMGRVPGETEFIPLPVAK